MTLPTRAALAALTLLLAAPAVAADVPASGRKLQIRDDARTQSLALDVKDPAVAAPSPGSGEDPTLTGASLVVRNPSSGEAATFILPAVGWKSSGNGSSYKFHNPEAPGGISPVKSARIKDGSIKVRARASGITLDEASQGSVSISLASGSLRV